MEITYAPRGILQIDDATIIHRNFSGKGSDFNRDGDRNFSLLIKDEEIARELLAAGWNVKIKEPRNEEEGPFMYLPVKVKFNDRGPNIYVQTNKVRVKLTEENVSMIDNIDISSVDLDIRPYDWCLKNGKEGRSAYLQNMRVVQDVDRFYEPEFNE